MSLSDSLFSEEDRLNEIRFWLGEVDMDVVADTTLMRFLSRNEDIYGADLQNQCQVIYSALLDTLGYLIQKAHATQGESRGIQTKRREKIGGIDVSVENSATAGNTQNGWERMLEDYYNNPSLICQELVRERGIATIVIGGTSQTDRDRYNRNEDNETVYDQASPFTPEQSNTLLRSGNLFAFRRSRYPTRRFRY